MTELFARQRKFAGERLVSLNEGEPFILYDFAVVLENDHDLVPESPKGVDKTELIIGLPPEGTPMLYSTLSGPIRDLAYLNVRDKKGKPTATDLPAMVCYKKVETKRSRESGFSEAVVLEFVAPYVDPQGKDRELPAWSFQPITSDSNPL